MYACFAAGAKAAIPVHAVATRDLSRFLSRRGKRQAHWLKQAGFTGAAGSLHLIPAADGAVAAAVLGLGKGNDPFALAACAENLKSGIYRLDDVPDWAGGTNIGGSLREFNERHAPHMLRGRSAVIFLSDGWDRCSATEMRNEMAKLRRRAQKVLWLNPLLGTSGYQPLTQGMQCALPYLDHF
ncbi:MAG: VWA domain-containing protein, partial [Alphaproteobacteria bacterium]|nr:VWA domain-containing protein [Alphaproteobacteria bacterium]